MLWFVNYISIKLFVLLCLVTQSCPTLCNPMDCSPPGSSVCGDSPGKNTHGLPYPSPKDLPHPGTEPRSSALHVDSLPSEPPGNPRILRWVACPFPRGSSLLKNWTGVSFIAGGFFTSCAPGKRERVRLENMLWQRDHFIWGREGESGCSLEGGCRPHLVQPAELSPAYLLLPSAGEAALGSSAAQPWGICSPSLLLGLFSLPQTKRVPSCSLHLLSHHSSPPPPSHSGGHPSYLLRCLGRRFLRQAYLLSSLCQWAAMRWLGVNLLGNGPEPREGEDRVAGADGLRGCWRNIAWDVCKYKTIRYSYMGGTGQPGRPNLGV